MPHGVPAIRPPVKWHGGKHYLARRIAETFPAHKTYVEPFGGGASVLLNKPHSPIEVYNDLDRDLVNLFDVLRDHSTELRRVLVATPYSELEFDTAKNLLNLSFPMNDGSFAMSPDNWRRHLIERARVFYVRCRQSIGGRGDAWSYTLHRVRRGVADVVSAWLSSIDEELPRITNRLRAVQITCRDWPTVIAKWDSPETLFYCDPPYVADTRVSPAVYQHEFRDEDHRLLAGVLKDVTGKVVLSGYPSPLYDELYDGWRRVSFDLPNHAAGGETKRRMEETLWFNF